jgi:hypothetical protein
MARSYKDLLADQKFDRVQRKKADGQFRTAVNIRRLSYNIDRLERQAREDQRQEKRRALADDLRKEKALVLERLASWSCSDGLSNQERDKWRDDLQKIDVTGSSAALELKRLRERVENHRRVAEFISDAEGISSPTSHRFFAFSLGMIVWRLDLLIHLHARYMD